jgi:hypothetical protein
MAKRKPKKSRHTWPKTHTFNGVEYDLDIREKPYKGMCAYPDGQAEITIMRRLDTRIGLDVAIHEATHALCPEVGEGDVTKLATELARWLWRLGYRMTVKGKKGRVIKK